MTAGERLSSLSMYLVVTSIEIDRHHPPRNRPAWCARNATGQTLVAADAVDLRNDVQVEGYPYIVTEVVMAGGPCPRMRLKPAPLYCAEKPV